MLFLFYARAFLHFALVYQKVLFYIFNDVR